MKISDLDLSATEYEDHSKVMKAYDTLFSKIFSVSKPKLKAYLPAFENGDTPLCAECFQGCLKLDHSFSKILELRKSLTEKLKRFEEKTANLKKLVIDSSKVVAETVIDLDSSDSDNDEPDPSKLSKQEAAHRSKSACQKLRETVLQNLKHGTTNNNYFISGVNSVPQLPPSLDIDSSWKPAIIRANPTSCVYPVLSKPVTINNLVTSSTLNDLPTVSSGSVIVPGSTGTSNASILSKSKRKAQKPLIPATTTKNLTSTTKTTKKYVLAPVNYSGIGNVPNKNLAQGNNIFLSSTGEVNSVPKCTRAGKISGKSCNLQPITPTIQANEPGQFFGTHCRSNNSPVPAHVNAPLLVLQTPAPTPETPNPTPVLCGYINPTVVVGSPVQNSLQSFGVPESNSANVRNQARRLGSSRAKKAKLDGNVSNSKNR